MRLGAIITWRTIAQISVPGILLWIVLLCVIPLLGGDIDLKEALAEGPMAQNSTSALIFWQTRLPRVLLALLVGGSLSLAGLVFQAVLRNPLAEPYILGVSGGAALGKMVAALLIAAGSGMALWGVPVFCFAGAVAPIVLLQLISRRMERFSSVTVLLGGVMLNVFFSSVILLLQYFADLSQVRQMFVWMMGGLDVVGYREIAATLPITAVCAFIIASHGRALNLLSLDKSTAIHLGLDVERTATRLIWTSSILTGTAVAVSGPIGFVGLIVPHSLRLLTGSENRVLIPASFLFGGVFLALCDLCGWRGMEMLQWLGLRTGQISEIPVGVITALLGGPFFLFLLVRDRRRLG